MSAIGDYIHLTAEGYSRYGISKNNEDEGKSMSLAKSIEKQKSQIHRRLINNTKNIIDKNINIQAFEDILNETKENLEKQTEDDNSIRAQLKKRLDDKFGKIMGEIDWSTMNVSEKQEQKSSVSYIRQK